MSTSAQSPTPQPAQLTSAPMFKAGLGAVVIGTALYFMLNLFGGGDMVAPRFAVYAYITLAHLFFGVWLIIIGRTLSRKLGFILGVTTFLASLSWATWAVSAWEELLAGRALPIINIAGLPGLVLTPLIILVSLIAIAKRA